MTSQLRILFFGTPEPARQIFENLAKSDHEIVGVVTQPDRRRGRGSKLISTPVKEAALELGIEVFEPNSKLELEECVLKTKADIGIVVAYGRILPKSILEHFPKGCINVHYSILPRWRGAAPVERAILAGDQSSGVSIMKMDEGLDTGGVYAYRSIDITNTTTSASLFRTMNAIAGDLLLVVLENLDSQSPLDQEGEPTYAAKLDQQDFFFDSNTSVVQVDRQIRAGSLVKGAWTYIGKEKFRIIAAGIPEIVESQNDSIGNIDRSGRLWLADGSIVCNKIQTAGKPVLDFDAWANGISKELFPLKIDS